MEYSYTRNAIEWDAKACMQETGRKSLKEEGMQVIE